ncbi:MAG: polymer-forming cytoskeletal protein [Alphaproteobacteria bacterium]|nr:polymer-forming cytoskeletal protein [Alphaproteobacteria bacterium]
MFGPKSSNSVTERPGSAASSSPTPEAAKGGEARDGEAARSVAQPIKSILSRLSSARSDTAPAMRPVAVKPEPTRADVAKPDPNRSEAAKPSQVEGKKLMVGRDIFLSGEIAACDLLIVEGKIEATLRNSNAVEIAESGTFKGTAEIEKADVSGLFDGDLTVRDRLIVRRSGRIKGKLRYGSIQIEPGGEVSGTVEILPKPGAKPEAKVATGD